MYDMAPSYTSATASTPPDHQYHHHGTPYYTSQVSAESYSSTTSNASNQGLHGSNSDNCNNDRNTPPSQGPQASENAGSTSGSYYNATPSGLHQHQLHQQDTSVVPQQPHDDNVIITSDNGLSYTNLDYGNQTGQPYHHPHHHNTMTPPNHAPEHHAVIYPTTTINYATKNHHEEMIHQGSHQHEEILPHHVNHHHHHPLNQQEGYNVSGGNYLHHPVSSPEANDATQYSPVMAQHHHQSPPPLATEYHGIHNRHYKEEPCHSLLSEIHQHQMHSSGTPVGSGNGTVMMTTSSGSSSFHHHHPLHHHMHHQNTGHHHHHHHHLVTQQQHHQQQSQTTAAVPTYKWMQVKRNVPKPAVYRGTVANALTKHWFLTKGRTLQWFIEICADLQSKKETDDDGHLVLTSPIIPQETLTNY
ncbi:hypothetical protein C0J52_17180 [Blattella germanica]|nr:hypothetical protein C0J52_17180 [Blattella germanica]